MAGVIYGTRGVVLNHIKYNETSVIVHVYTELLGRQSYLVNHVRSVKNKGKTVFLQPLALLDLQVYHSPKKEVQRIKDFRISDAFSSIPFDQTKRSIAFFVTEVLKRSLREEESNPDLFVFIYESVRHFDGMTVNAHVFHLWFLAQLTRFLGFFPDFSENVTDAFFDLRNGECSTVRPSHDYYLHQSLFADWLALYQGHIDGLLSLSSSRRNELADTMLLYYALHLDGFGHFKSFDVLKDFYSF
ncbi:MAG: DNA repair protein RecO [Breznakibacter sp.]